MSGTPIQDFPALLGPHLKKQTSPGHGPFFSIEEQPLRQVSGATGRTLAESMRDCLKLGIWPERFRANRGAYTENDQIRLLESTVALLGAGGLGGTAATLLARAGVGRLIICDGDCFAESNLNRQLFSTTSRLGLNKAFCAAEDIRAFNPAVEVVVHPVFADEGNIKGILGQAMAVVDCLDNMPARYLAERTARELGKPFIHGAIAGQEGLMMTIFPEDPGLESVYSGEPAAKSGSAETLLGTPAVTPAILAGLEAQETINILLSRKPLARRKLLHLDLTIPELEINNLA